MLKQVDGFTSFASSLASFSAQRRCMNGQIPESSEPFFVLRSKIGTSNTRCFLEQGAGEKQRWTQDCDDERFAFDVPSALEDTEELSSLMCASSTSPAAVFGSPLSDADKQRNKEIIRAMKSHVFDTFFPGEGISRAFARFYALETIARMPYFSYVSVLHLFETFGWWRRADYMKLHFAESFNELHHLLIMEELGGSDKWSDRFIAQHIAFGYYWMVVALYIFNPAAAYNLNEAVEEEAAETYTAFIQQHADYLQSQPAPSIAVKYYSGNDLYMFDTMQNLCFKATGITQSDGMVNADDGRRRPVMKTLYDAFVAVRDDEIEHAKTMAYLQHDNDRAGHDSPTVTIRTTASTKEDVQNSNLKPW